MFKIFTVSEMLEQFFMHRKIKSKRLRTASDIGLKNKILITKFNYVRTKNLEGRLTWNKFGHGKNFLWSEFGYPVTPSSSYVMHLTLIALVVAKITSAVGKSDKSYKAKLFNKIFSDHKICKQHLKGRFKIFRIKLKIFVRP